MAYITQTISIFPPAPDSSTDTPTEFNSKADAFVNHQASVYIGEVNQWATEANGLKSDMNQLKTDIGNIVATIPDGSIDDVNISSTNVFSNQKVEADFIKTVNADAKYMTETDADAKYMIETDADATYVKVADFKSGGTVDNGWTKYPDGTLEVRRTSAVTTKTSTQSGAIYFGAHSGLSLSGAQAGNPPAFISPPFCIYGVNVTAGVCWATVGFSKATTTEAKPVLIGQISTGEGYLTVIAKGRWK